MDPFEVYWPHNGPLFGHRAEMLGSFAKAIWDTATTLRTAIVHADSENVRKLADALTDGDESVFMSLYNNYPAEFFVPALCCLILDEHWVTVKVFMDKINPRTKVQLDTEEFE